MKVKMKLKIKYKAFYYVHSEQSQKITFTKPVQKSIFKIPAFPALNPSLA